MTRKPMRRVGIQDIDPLQGVANLFDVGVVFALGFLLALMASSGVGRALLEKAPSGRSDREMLEPTPESLARLGRYRVSDRTLGGKGVRLGTAWRLAGGEVVYVPDRGRK